MKSILIALTMSLTLAVYAQQKSTIYLFPGEGSDERIFSKFYFDTNYSIVHVVLPTPKVGETMKSYAQEISSQIDTNGKYIFIGVSLGGMVCVELADTLSPEKVIIISSAKSRKELPHRYRFQRIIPINKLVPQNVVKSGARLLQPIVEPDRKMHADIFDSMLASKNPEYYKRTVDLILNWKRSSYNDKVIHIHGDNDHTLPLRKVKADYIVEGGSHMMALTKGEEVNELVQSILRK